MTRLTRELAERFAAIALGHVEQEYPNKLDHIMSGPDDVRGPRELHPVFYGSFDWHSCVHGYWLLARLTRRYPDLSQGAEIASLFDRSLTPESVAGERAYLKRPDARGFERPYGWAWLLALQAELERHEGDAGRRAADTLRPLAKDFADRFRAFLPLADYPVRVGAHPSTAFALRLAADHAERADPSLFALMRVKVLGWYGADANAPALEPGQDDFLSPTLVEAECMRRFLAPADFVPWFDAFLPDAAGSEPATLFSPARVSDRTDGKIAHLDGLNFSRAWCARSIAAALPVGHPARATLSALAEAHLVASLPHVSGDYMGEHWLATFALLALDAP